MPVSLCDQLEQKAASLAPGTPPLPEPPVFYRRPRYTPELREIVRAFGSSPDVSSSLASIAGPLTPSLRDLYLPGSSASPSPGFGEGLTPFQSLDSVSFFGIAQPVNGFSQEQAERDARDARRAGQVAAMSNLYFPSLADAQAQDEPQNADDDCTKYINATEDQYVANLTSVPQNALAKFGACSPTSSPELPPTNRNIATLPSHPRAVEMQDQFLVSDQSVPLKSISKSMQVSGKAGKRFSKEKFSAEVSPETTASQQEHLWSDVDHCIPAGVPEDQKSVEASVSSAVEGDGDVELDQSQQTDTHDPASFRDDGGNRMTLSVSRGLRSSKKRRQLEVDRATCSADQSKRNRAAALERLRAKRRLRCFDYKVRYACRKRIALVRPRINGRFATKKEVAEAKRMGIPLQ